MRFSRILGSLEAIYPLSLSGCLGEDSGVARDDHILMDQAWSASGGSMGHDCGIGCAHETLSSLGSLEPYSLSPSRGALVRTWEKHMGNHHPMNHTHEVIA